jgi:regulator of replication initiation timing
VVSAPAFAQQPPAVLDQTVRRVVSTLAEAQTLLLQLPDLVEQNQKLTKENDDLKSKCAQPKVAPDGK